MAKDPAFLFYPNDFDAATKFFTDEQVGIYLRLLIAQFQHGRLSEKQVLFISKKNDAEIMAKFSRDESGLFFNERLEHEITRRKLFSESRKNNRKGKLKNISSTSDEDMETETENETVKGKKKKEKSEVEKILLPFSDKFADKWEEWKRYKSEQHKFKYKSKRTEEISVEQLVKLSKNSEADAVKIIDQSIANGWKGFFELKNNNNGTVKQPLTTNSKQVGVSQLLAKTKRDFQTFSGGSTDIDS